jgi:hypothetical protein
MSTIQEKINTLVAIIQTNNNQNHLSPEDKQILETEIKRLKAELVKQQAKL